MKILVAVAHSNELKIIKDSIKKLNLVGVQITFIQTGIGNYETIYNLTRKLEMEKYDFILNIGICGFLKENPGLIQIVRIINLGTKKELLVPVIFEFTKLESIGCSDFPVSNIEQLNEEIFVDMESFGIEFIVSKFQIPRLILKLPADKIGDKLDIALLKESCMKLGTEIDYDNLFKQIISYINSIPKEENLDYLKDNYHFTFQELEIMKLRINKFEALNQAKFKDFFNENIKLEKKDFLIKLEQNTSI